MSVFETRFTLTPVHERGARALERGLDVLRALLPYAQIEALWLDHRAFLIDTHRFPITIWQRLLSNPAWHPKLVSHLYENLLAPDEQAKAALQARFLRLLAKQGTRVRLVGRILFDSECTPGWLSTAIIPQARMHGCRLMVDALSELIRANAATASTLQIAMLQRSCYDSLASS